MDKQNLPKEKKDLQRETLKLIEKIDKKTIKKAWIIKNNFKGASYGVNFRGTEVPLTFVLDGEKNLLQVNVIKSREYFMVNIKDLDKKEKEKVINLFNDYILYFNLRLRLLLS